MPLVERMSILNRLATWALLKGPVSIEMVAEILNEHPDNPKALNEVSEIIDIHEWLDIKSKINKLQFSN